MTSATYVEIDKAQVLEQLLRATEILDANHAGKATADAQTTQLIVEALDDLQKAPINQPEGGLRVLIKDTHINLRGTLWEIVALGTELSIEHNNPVAVALAVAKAVRSICEKIKRLDDPMELLVARAIVGVAAVHKRSGQILAVPEVSVDEITGELRAQGFPSAPANLSELLAHLRGGHIVKEVFHEDRGPYYVVTF